MKKLKKEVCKLVLVAVAVAAVVLVEAAAMGYWLSAVAGGAAAVLAANWAAGGLLPKEGDHDAS